MRRLYSVLLALVACAVMASAEDWNIVINVLEGADRVDAVVGYYRTSESAEKITFINGENKVVIPSGQSLYVTPLNATDIVSFTDRDGDKVSSYGGYYEIYASDNSQPYSPYTLSVADESTYRSKSVNVTMDDCSLVTIARADGTEFKPEENSITIPYNPDMESRLTIKPRSYSGLIYKVTADGADVEKVSSYFYVNLVDNSGDEPVYVENVDITANYPEGLTFNTTITLDGPVGMISTIKINNIEVEDLAACLDSDGFDTNPGDKITIVFDTDHKIDEIYDNDESKYAYGQLTIDGIDRDHKVVIKGHAYEVFEVKFNVTGAEGVKGSLGSTVLELTDGENIKKFSEKNNYITFSARNGYVFTKFTDGETDYLSLDDWTTYGSVYLSVAAGQEYTIEAEKIRRDNQLVIYYDDFSSLEFSYFTTKFKNYDELPDEITPGYNTINFRDEDGYLSVFASGDYDGFYAYKNSSLIEPDYEGAKYFEDYNVADKDVYKVFFINNPGGHTVDFDVAEGVLDGYEVKKDIIIDVDTSAPVKAVGPTRFTISPVSSDTEDLIVKVGEQSVEAVDGVFTFETTADTVVLITKDSSGIGNILPDNNSAVDVYNLQGIRVASPATAADVKALPSGLYIINGSKVLVK